MNAGTLVIRTAKFSWRWRRRALVVGGCLAAAATVTMVLALCLGTYPVSIGDLLASVWGTSSPAVNTVVWEWRAPRAITAAMFGAALALSGAVFQSLTRNPLGSPDIVGFSTGSFTGVLLVILAGGAGFYTQATGALAGGLATTLLVYLFAFRRGVQGFRFIIVGIAVSSMLTSFNTWITVKAEVDIALQAAVWGAGTLNGLRWEHAVPGLIAATIFAATLLLASPRLRVLELGDDTASMLGIRVERAKLSLIVLAVGLMATVTAVAGPISFVALAAPQIARRLCGGGATNLSTAALAGAAMLSGSDVLAQHAFSDIAIPVGAVTVCVGGCYLVWLLARETKRS